MDTKSEGELKAEKRSYSDVHTPARKRGKGRRRKKKDKRVEFDKVPGVVKLVLSLNMQTVLGCVIDENVTCEDPWMFIDKEAVDDDLEVREELSDFFPIKKELQSFKTKRLLIGYVLEESAGANQFFICTTKAAEEAVQDIIDKIKREYEARMYSSVAKEAKPWVSLGSEKEIDEQNLSRHRSLFEIEVESRYPIMSSKVQFRMRTAEDVRDGYVELTQGRLPINAVFKKRINAAVQAAPIYTVKEVQTICPYPKNAWTQYQYDYRMDVDPSEKYKSHMDKFIEDRMDEICDSIRVNGHINFYSNDYENLVVNEKFTKAYEAVLIREFMSFTDIKLCRDKMIASVSWHPYLTGVVACAYADTSLNNYMPKTAHSDEHKKITHSTNPVLIWSFVDGLKPKLILEAHREVNSISFCPYDDGIIIGGCRNGQIIIWDIKNRLQKVEQEEVLSPTQQKYRTLMWSFMSWMKNIKNIALVPIAAISDLEYSHYSTVVNIEWMPPYQEMSKTGQVKQILEERDTLSYQFITTSLDGYVLFWDLKTKPVMHAGEYRPQRRLRRLKRRPSALTMDISPYKALHRIFKPMYKLKVIHSDTLRTHTMTSVAFPYYKINYKEVSPDKNQKYNPLNRITFEPVLVRNNQKYEQKFNFGTTEGTLALASWEGYEYSSGEIVSQEQVKILNLATYHDGPISSISKWPTNPKILLTVGGKIFCIWNEDLKDRPILWRRNRVKYTYGTWNYIESTTFKLMRSDGIYETWGLFLKSNNPIRQQTVSGHLLTGSYEQEIFTSVLAIADFNGSLRIYHSAGGTSNPLKNTALNNWFDTQVQIITEFIDWQIKWTKKHAGHIQILKEEAIRNQKLKEQQEETERLRKEEERDRLAKEEAKQAALKLKPPPGQYKQWAENKWIEREQGRMNRVLLHLKQLNPDTLRKQQEPLKKIEMEEAHKRQKQAARHADSEKIFNESVAMYFPHVLQKPPPPPRDPYAGGDSLESKEKTMTNYKSRIPDTKKYIDTHPFIHYFDWHSILKSQKERKRNQSAKYMKEATHKERYAEKKLRSFAEAEEVSVARSFEEDDEESTANDEAD